MPLHDKTEKGRPKVVRKLTTLVTIQEGPADNRHTQGYKEVKKEYYRNIRFKEI